MITLVTLSGSDKANDLLSSQIDSLIWLPYEIKVNDREGFQTLPFKFPLSCLWEKPMVEKWNMIKAGMTVLALIFSDPICTNPTAFKCKTKAMISLSFHKCRWHQWRVTYKI